MSKLKIESLEQGCSGITPYFGGFMSECAIFCLYSQSHSSGTILKIKNESGLEIKSIELEWDTIVSNDMIRTMNDYERTTDFGAMGLAVLYILNFTIYRHFTTSFKGTGVDFWLYEKEPEDLDFESANARLEISGIRRSSPTNNLKTRFNIKDQQVKLSNWTETNIFIVLTEFGKPETLFSQK